MRERTATALVSAHDRPSTNVQSAGPCMVDGCGGSLEVRHERQFGKVYTVCPACEHRVTLVARLRAQVAQLHAKVAELQKPITAQAMRDGRATRDADIEKRYRAGTSAHVIAAALGVSLTCVLRTLRNRSVPIRPRGRPTTPMPSEVAS